MGTFSAYLKKETLESFRQSKYLILTAFFGFFALSTPIMLKLLPGIIRSQMPGFPLELMQFDAVYSVQNYIKSIYQLGNMVVALSLMGLLTDERLQGKLVFPISQGAGLAGIVAAKLAHYIATVSGIVFVITMLNYYYSVVLFPEGNPSIASAARCASLLAAYFATRVVLVTFAGAVFTRPLAVGLTTLVVSYLEPIAASFQRSKSLVANSLINVASQALGTGTSAKMTPGAGTVPSSGATAVVGAGTEVNGWVLSAALVIEVAAMVLLTIWRMKRLEIAPGAERG